MAPHIFDDDEEGYFKPLPLLYSGTEKVQRKDQVYQPHVFQQSVTLTATMWNENESKGRWDTWKIGNWGVIAEHSPLFLGLICGFGIVLIAVTSVLLWRYCVLTASKKVCCTCHRLRACSGRGNYDIMSCRPTQNNAPIRLERKEGSNCFDNFHRIEVHPLRKNLTLQRSVTVDSIPLNVTSVPGVDLENRLSKCREQSYQTSQSSNLYMEPTQVEPLMSRDVYTSHLYLNKFISNSDLSKNTMSQSTPAIEDLYAKVNFSKKRKNRMRKGDAAVIAMSKSHSGNSGNAMDDSFSGIVVYNERTAL